MTWTLVVPVKHTANGKSRLAPYIGRRRPELARAMTLDTAQAALDATLVVEMIVVTNDPGVGADLEVLGGAAGRRARVLPDEPDLGLNAALRYGAMVARGEHPERGVAAISSDLPALRAAELDRALRAAATHRNAFVPDAQGVGTTLYSAAPGADFAPRFGLDSRIAHRESGAVELALPTVPTLRRDVDVEQDLDEVVGLGIGHRTRQVLARLGAVL